MAVTAELDLRIAEFTAALKQAEGQMRGFSAKADAIGNDTGAGIGGGISAAVTGALGAIAVAATAAAAIVVTAFGGVAAGLKNAFDVGGHLSDSAAQMQTTAGKAQVLEQSFTNAGLGAEAAVTSVNKFQKSLSDALDKPDKFNIFQEIGLDPASLAKLDPTDAFQQVGAAIASINDPTKRAAASMEVFGKSGGKLLSLFGDAGTIAFTAEQLGEQSAILDESAGDFDRISDILGGAFLKLQGFFVGMGSRLVDQLAPMFNEFNKLDLASIGKQFGDYIATAFSYIKAVWETLDWRTGTEIVKDGLSIAIKSAVNVLWAGLWGAVRASGQYLIEEIKTAVTALSIVTTADFWRGMLEALKGVALTFVSLIQQAIGHVLQEIRKIPGVGRAVGTAGDDLVGIGKLTGQDAEDAFAGAKDALAPAWDDMTKRLAEAGRNIAEAFARGYEDTDNIFDTSDETRRLEEASKRISEAAAANAQKTAAVASAAESATADGGGTNGPAFSTPGALASAINVIAGRSANELILSTAQAQLRSSERAEKHLDTIAKNTANKTSSNAPAPSPNNGGGVFT